MNIFDLPIKTDETLKDKTRAFIYENKIICHPDLKEKVTEGMNLMRASAEGFKKDIAEMTKAPEEENELKRTTDDTH
jgi:regulatory protein YycI of two-component signal transduction system YycFG